MTWINQRKLLRENKHLILVPLDNGNIYISMKRELTYDNKILTLVGCSDSHDQVNNKSITANIQNKKPNSKRTKEIIGNSIYGKFIEHIGV